MLKPLPRHVLRILVMCAVALLPAQSMHAHGGPPRVELDIPRASAGDPLGVRGINLGADLAVTVTLSGAGAEYPLGTAVCDGQGDFSSIYTLPRDLAPGAYTVRAVNSSNFVVETHLEIEGALSLAKLKRWVTSLPSIQWPLVLGVLALIFAGLALVFRWKDARDATRQ